MVVDLERSLLGLGLEPTFDTSLQRRDERLVAELLPALAGLVNRDDQPTTVGRAGYMSDLTVRSSSVEGCTALIDASY